MNPNIKWFKEAKYGMFIHWGLYSLLAGEYKGEPSSVYAEWIQSRCRIPNAEYEKLCKAFNPVFFDADEIVKSSTPSSELSPEDKLIRRERLRTLYKAISEDKEKKTILRTMLEYLMQKTKIITIIGLILMVIPYVLFACFSKMDGKGDLLLATPISALIVYVMLYLVFVFNRKNPFCCQLSSYIL